VPAPAAVRALLSALAAAAFLAGAAAPAARAGDRTEDPVAVAEKAAAAKEFARAESILRERIEAAPGDRRARFLLARVLHWQGKRPASLEQYDVLLREEPGNADYLLGKASVLWFEGRPAQALPLLDAAIARSPDYEDAHRLRLRVLQETGDTAGFAAARAEIAKRFPGREAGFLAGPAARGGGDGPRRGEGEAGYRYEVLSGDRRTWREEYAEGLFRYSWPREPGPLTDRALLETRLRRTDRFGEADESARATFSAPADARWTAILSAEGSPTHRVLPRWAGEAEAAFNAGRGWALHAGGRRTAYEDADVGALFAGFEKYAGSWRFAATGTATRLFGGGNALGGAFQADRYYGIEGRSRIGLAGGFGEEIESLGAGVRSNRFVSAALHGRHWISGRWAFTWEAGVTVERTLYTRTGVLLGIRYSF
jgi:YaiO family outer membrane protein